MRWLIELLGFPALVRGHLHRRRLDREPRGHGRRAPARRGAAGLQPIAGRQRRLPRAARLLLHGDPPRGRARAGRAGPGTCARCARSRWTRAAPSTWPCSSGRSTRMPRRAGRRSPSWAARVTSTPAAWTPSRSWRASRASAALAPRGRRVWRLGRPGRARPRALWGPGDLRLVRHRPPQVAGGAGGHGCRDRARCRAAGARVRDRDRRLRPRADRPGGHGRHGLTLRRAGYRARPTSGSTSPRRPGASRCGRSCARSAPRACASGSCATTTALVAWRSVPTPIRSWRCWRSRCSRSPASATGPRAGPTATRLDALNDAILHGVRARGRTVTSSTRVDGRFALRPCFVNPRTTLADADALVDEVLRVGRELMAAAAH